MYVYFYDTFVSEPKYQTVLARIETRLTDLGIAGKIFRLSVLTSIREFIAEAVKKGADTLVAVGNDRTLTKILPLVAGGSITLGYIPLAPPTRLADYFGLPFGEKACDSLSARVVERLDLGRANSTYFLSGLEVPAGDCLAQINGQYSVRPKGLNQTLAVYNLGWPKSDPQDGRLEVVVHDTASKGFRLFSKAASQPSVFPAKTVLLESATIEAAVADGEIVIKLPATVEVAQKKLKIIVGKERGF